MKKNSKILPLLGFIAASLGVIILSSIFYASLSSSKTAPGVSSKVNCQKHYLNHVVIIQNNLVIPENTRASLCDTLTIVNKDNVLREIAFGQHDNHQPYDGVLEKALDQNASFSVVLNQLGTYIFHDHLEDAVKGSFTVASRT